MADSPDNYQQYLAEKHAKLQTDPGLIAGIVEKDFSWYFLFVLVLVCIVVALLTPDNAIRFGALLFSGLLLGYYYGKFNDYIFHYPSFVKPVWINKYAEINTWWVHTICSMSGSVALYFIILRVTYFDCHCLPFVLNTADLILLGIFILGYTGLLPMTLWFFANSGQALKELLTRGR